MYPLNGPSRSSSDAASGSRPSPRDGSAFDPIARSAASDSTTSRASSSVVDTVAAVLDRLYAIGLRPDWWKLEPQRSSKGWGRTAKVIESRDPYCRGVLLLGLEAAEDTLLEDFALAAECRWVKGFAVGRTIFAERASKKAVVPRWTWCSGSRSRM